MPSIHIIAPGSTIALDKRDPYFGGEEVEKKAVQKQLKHLYKRLNELQELLYAEAKRSLLIVFQATDTGGKDGVIRHVTGQFNPQGCVVTSFKVPTDIELAHDFLWRVHNAVPPKRMVGVFNRSHYEDVLIARVRNLVPQDVWERRYDHINWFERHLSENDVIIAKFFLHISKDEQKRRLQARLDNHDKWWKFSLGDLRERERWDQYQLAYEAMINRTSTDWARWCVVPSNHKWFRNYVVARELVHLLEAQDMKYPEPQGDLAHVTIPD